MKKVITPKIIKALPIKSNRYRVKLGFTGLSVFVPPSGKKMFHYKGLVIGQVGVITLKEAERFAIDKLRAFYKKKNPEIMEAKERKKAKEIKEVKAIKKAKDTRNAKDIKQIKAIKETDIQTIKKGTFHFYMKKWLIDVEFTTDNIKRDSISLLVRFVLPYFGNMNIKQIKPTQLIKLIEKLMNENKNRAGRIRRLLITLFAWLESSEVITDNPTLRLSEFKPYQTNP